MLFGELHEHLGGCSILRRGLRSRIETKAARLNISAQSRFLQRTAATAERNIALREVRDWPICPTASTMPVFAHDRIPELNSEPALYVPVLLPPPLAGPYYSLTPDGPAGAATIELDRERDSYLAAKRHVLQRAGRGPLRVPGHDAQLELARVWLQDQLRAQYPQLFAAAGLANAGLDELLLEVQEDLAIMSRPVGLASERSRAIYLHVCFPSGWSPARMLGKSFTALHGRVPNEQDFARRERAQHARALFERPQVRFVWSLTADPALDHHPEVPREHDWTTTTEAYLRVERQVMVPLGSNSAEPSLALFLIRTYVYRVVELETQRRVALRGAFMQLSEAVRHHRGMLGHEPRILALLK
jgi:hypothetical protein